MDPLWLHVVRDLEGFMLLIASYISKEGADKLIKLWDAYTGEILRTLEGHEEGISDIAWSFDGHFLASVSDDKTVRIWDMSLVGCILPSAKFARMMIARELK